MNTKKINVRRGRPPLPREQVRNNRVVTFLTDHEMARLQKISRQDRGTLSSVCRRIISSYLDQNPAP